MLVEVVLAAGLDVRPLDGHEAVAILPALLVPQPDRVPDLVDGVAPRATVADRDLLPAPLPADLRPAAAGVDELDVVHVRRGVRRCALDEGEVGVGLPVRDRLGDASLVADVAADLPRHRAVPPPVPVAGDADARCRAL